MWYINITHISNIYDREYYKDATTSVLNDDIHNNGGSGGCVGGRLYGGGRGFACGVIGRGEVVVIMISSWWY